MSAVKWTKLEGFRSYESECGRVDIMFCANVVGTPWRARDNRYLPAPLDECMSFHRTLAEAKAWVESNTRTERVAALRRVLANIEAARDAAERDGDGHIREGLDEAIGHVQDEIRRGAS